MTSRAKWGAGSVVMVLVAAGLLIWLYRRKPGVVTKTKTIETFVFETKVPADVFPSWNDSAKQPESEMDRLIRESNAAIAADDLDLTTT